MLEAQDISFRYDKGRLLFDRFSCAIGPQERVALQAPSGFGKSTLCRIFSGYEQLLAGRVICDGEPLPLRGICPVQLIMQHPELAVDPRMRMRAMLAEGGAVDDGLLDRLGIRREWLNRFPHELSGGELQRLCIARALSTRPRYLVCDEVSTMLDALTQARIWRVLLDYAHEEGAGMLFVSHSPALTDQIATRVIDLTQEAGD